MKNIRHLMNWFIGLAAAIAPATVQAQTTGGAWQVREIEGQMVATAGAGFLLMCSQGTPSILFALQPPPSRNPAQVRIVIDGAEHFVEVAQPRADAMWGAFLPDSTLVDALRNGSEAAFHIEGRVRATVSLAGSGEAIGGALEACLPQLIAEEEAPLPEVPAGERTAIMRAAGFTLSRGKWTTCEGDETGDISQYRDVNGDGAQDALVSSYGTACRGFTGSGFALLTRQGSGWRVLAESTGIAELFPRQGIAWPDIEIGGPGTDCFAFLRWNGREYVRGGTSLGGEICTLDPVFANAAGANNAGRSGEGILGQVPVRLGYYVEQGERCERPSYLYKFETNRHLEIAEGNGSIELLVYDYARVSSQDDGFYFIQLADAGPEDPEDIGVRAMGGGRIDLLIQDIVELVHCQEENVPSRLRR